MVAFAALRGGMMCRSCSRSSRRANISSSFLIAVVRRNNSFATSFILNNLISQRGQHQRRSKRKENDFPRTSTSIIHTATTDNDDDTSSFNKGGNREYDYYNQYTVVKLKELLRKEGLKVSGRKADLIERLGQYHNQRSKSSGITNSSNLTVSSSSAVTSKNPTAKKSTQLSSSTAVTTTKSKRQPSKSPSAAAHQRITDRDIIPKLWNENEAMKNHGSYTFKIMSWNVAGLRALMRKQPTVLSDIAKEHNLDVICLQETKLQEMHVTDPKLRINEILVDDGYDSYYSCSTIKKGYSGTGVYVKRNDHLMPTNVSYKMNMDEQHDHEGRIITVDYPLFSVVNLYVPNSGQNLQRLDYRIQSWDRDLTTYIMEKEEKEQRPIIWLGDFNVAHKWVDVWNDGAKHLVKQAGTTQEERDSFQKMLHGNSDAESSSLMYVDAFRHLHPTAKGHYTYWSQRAGNRKPNKGLRIDYFLCSKSLMVMEDIGDSDDSDANEKVIVRDSYMIHEQDGSDHCPIVLEVEIKK